MNDKLNKVVPELRFPEFQLKGEWKIEQMESLYSFKNTYPITRDCLTYDKGFVKNIHYGDIHTKYQPLFNITQEVVPYIEDLSIKKIKPDSYCIEGDIIFADASEDLDGIGKCIEIVNLNNEKLISGLHTLLARQKKHKLIVGFGGYLFLSDSIRAQIQRESQGAKVLGVSATRLSNIRVPFPLDKKEQQKIANCLSYLDEFIKAQNEKLDAFKAHKKGLLKQLFPAEGETVPIIRFPEFLNNGEWKKKILAKISPIIFDGTHQTPKYVNEGIPFFSVENIISGNKNKFISREDYLLATCKNKPEKGDIILTRIGNIGFSAIVSWDYEFSIYVTLAVVKKSDQFNSYFLHSFFQSEFYQHEILSKSLLNAVPCKINMDELRKTNVLLPPNIQEQEKIADCFSSIDKLILAQKQKIEALKNHKKGLMQQLFPTIQQVC